MIFQNCLMPFLSFSFTSVSTYQSFWSTVCIIAFEAEYRYFINSVSLPFFSLYFRNAIRPKKKNNKGPKLFGSLFMFRVQLCYVSCIISNCRGFIFGYKFSFWIMAVFKCQQFCIVNLPVFKNRSLVSLANNYLVFLLQPNFFSSDFSGAFSFFFPLLVFFPC